MQVLNALQECCLRLMLATNDTHPSFMGYSNVAGIAPANFRIAVYEGRLKYQYTFPFREINTHLRLYSAGLFNKPIVEMHRHSIAPVHYFICQILWPVGSLYVLRANRHKLPRQLYRINIG